MISPRRSFSLLLVLFLACRPAAAGDAPKKASFLPHWNPQSQFAGYYVALEKGLYLKHGIDLTIQLGGDANPSENAMVGGTAEFASMWLANAVKLRANGIPVVNIAQLIRRSAIVLVAKKSSGISRPEDMNGKKIGIWNETFEMQLKEFLRHYHIDARIVYQPYSINLFLRGAVDVATTMWYNEYNTIINSGINEDELTTFFLADHNVNFPEDGIYCREELLKKDPELCRNFVEATLEGWIYAFRHQEEAVDIIMKYSRQANVSVNRTHQRWMLARLKDLLLPDGATRIATDLPEAGYRLVVDRLYENKTIGKKPPYSDIARTVVR